MPTEVISSKHAQFITLLNLEPGLDGNMQSGTDVATSMANDQSKPVRIDSRLMSRSRIDEF
jgi:hypothetical protein